MLIRQRQRQREKCRLGESGARRRERKALEGYMTTAGGASGQDPQRHGQSNARAEQSNRWHHGGFGICRDFLPAGIGPAAPCGKACPSPSLALFAVSFR